MPAALGPDYWVLVRFLVALCDRYRLLACWPGFLRDG
jgi:hypothetical protein